MTIQDRILYEKWQKQDTEKRLQRDHRQQELQEQVELSALDNIQQEIELKMKRLQMEREAKLMEVERLRSMRLAKEQSSEALESAERAALLLKKQQLLSNVVFTNDSSKARQDEDMLQSLLAQEQEKSKLKGIKPSSSEEALSKQAKAIQQRKQSLQQALQQINEESQQLLQAEQAFQLQQRKKEQEVKESMLYNDYLLSIQEIDDKMKTNEVELQDELHHLRYAKDLHSKQTMPIVHPTTSSANSGKTKKKVHMMDDEQEVPIRQEKAVSCSSMKETPSSSRGQSSSHVIPTNVGPVRVKNLSPENDDDTAVHDFDMNEDLLGKKSNHFTGEDEVEDVEMMPLDEAMNR